VNLNTTQPEVLKALPHCNRNQRAPQPDRTAATTATGCVGWLRFALRYQMVAEQPTFTPLLCCQPGVIFARNPVMQVGLPAQSNTYR